MVSTLAVEFTMSDTHESLDAEACLICRKTLGEAVLCVIDGETFCREDAENVVRYGIIGAACKCQFELALHAMSHRQRNIDGLYEELTALFEKYGLIERQD